MNKLMVKELIIKMCRPDKQTNRCFCYNHHLFIELMILGERKNVFYGKIKPQSKQPNFLTNVIPHKRQEIKEFLIGAVKHNSSKSSLRVMGTEESLNDNTPSVFLFSCIHTADSNAEVM